MQRVLFTVIESFAIAASGLWMKNRIRTRRAASISLFQSPGRARAQLNPPPARLILIRDGTNRRHRNRRYRGRTHRARSHAARHGRAFSRPRLHRWRGPVLRIARASPLPELRTAFCRQGSDDEGTRHGMEPQRRMERDRSRARARQGTDHRAIGQGGRVRAKKTDRALSSEHHAHRRPGHRPRHRRNLTRGYFDGAAAGGGLAMYSGAALLSCAKLKSLSENTALLALEDA